MTVSRPEGSAAIVPNLVIPYAPLVQAFRGSPANALVDIEALKLPNQRLCRNSTTS